MIQDFKVNRDSTEILARLEIQELEVKPDTLDSQGWLEDLVLRTRLEDPQVQSGQLVRLEKQEQLEHQEFLALEFQVKCISYLTMHLNCKKNKKITGNINVSISLLWR